jgi:hypothetical protein
MPSSAELFLNAMERLFGFEPAFYKGLPSEDGLATPSVLVFKNVPEQGYSTCVTYGLSLANHPKWIKQRRPELIMTVNSQDPVWAVALADMVSEMRGQFPFSYGQTILCPGPIAADAKMDGFLIFAPSIFSPEQYLDIEVGQPYKVCLTGIYPITGLEAALVGQHGLEKFWKSEGFDPLNVYR